MSQDAVHQTESSPDALLAALGRRVTHCRMCGSDALAEVLDLGFHAPSDAFLTKEQLRLPELTFPLNLLLCEVCGLPQISYVVRPDLMFNENYPYESSTTESGRRHFESLAQAAARRFAPEPGSLAVDVGSNVGVLLRGFEAAGMRVAGIEPSGNVAAQANAGGIDTVNMFFGGDAVDAVVGAHGQAQVVTATNVFAHVDDLNSFVDALKSLLTPTGVFVIEAPYFVRLLEHLEYDTIYHEHLSYLAVTPVARFFEQSGFEVFDVEEVGIHGGSMRFYVGYPGQHRVEGSVASYREDERTSGALTDERLDRFAAQVRDSRDKLVDKLYQLKAQGHRLAGIGAPAKGNTLLNYCRVGPDTLSYISEKSPLKIGLFTPGMHIPVVGDDYLINDAPDYGLLLPWNFADEVMRNLSGFRDAGGHFIIPIPEVTIV